MGENPAAWLWWELAAIFGAGLAILAVVAAWNELKHRGIHRCTVHRHRR
jgi:hypothetical protein